MLVVIAIISVLAAVLLPVFFSVRGKARQTVCVSNLRQIGLAIGMYSQDYDDLYPAGKDPSDQYCNPSLWASSPYQAQVESMPFLNDLLDSYIRSKDVWHCPSDSGYTELDISSYVNPSNTVPLDATPTAFDKYKTSYLYRTEIALLGTRYGSLTAEDAQGGLHEGAEVNVLMDGNGSWHGGRFANQKRYDELMGDGHVINQNVTQFGQTWQLRLKQQ